MTIVVINLMILFANLAVLGMSLKLYTEGMKDRSMNARAKAAKLEGAE